MENSSLSKSAIRKIYLQKRLELKPEQVLSYSNQINKNFIKNIGKFLPEISGKIIALYQPMKNEIIVEEIKNFLLANNAKVALPKISGKNNPLDFVVFYGQRLEKNSIYGVLEPVEGQLVIPDLVVVPLIAFDKSLTRIGMGAGFYDRTINFLRAGTKVAFVGVAYDFQYCDKIIKIEEFDQRLDFIASQHNFFTLKK